MSLIPKKSKPPKKGLVKNLMIVSTHKMGKTHALSKLDNALVIDLEDSMDYYGGTYINVKKECKEKDIGPLTYLKKVIQELEESDDSFDYIILDTITALETMCRPYATILYKKNHMAPDNNVKDIVRDGDYGIGYGYWRDAVHEFLTPLLELSKKSTIIVGHVKDASINVSSDNISVGDIDLMGKMRRILPQKIDSIGFLRIGDDNNERVLSFYKSNKDLVTGARPQHLKNKDILISRMQEDGNLETFWENIFTNLKEDK